MAAQFPTGGVRRSVPASAALLLDRAAAFIEKGWTTGAAARDEQGYCCAATDARAVKWCATGAMYAAEYASGLRVRQGVMTHAAIEHLHAARAAAERALKRAAAPGGIEFITGWNDRLHQTAANVADAMRRAAATLREPAHA